MKTKESKGELENQLGTMKTELDDTKRKLLEAEVKIKNDAELL